MSKRIVLALSHSIEEFDMLQLYHRLGYQVFSIGGYVRPGAPHDPKRPALPQVPEYPELIEAIDSLGTEDNLGAAQARIPEKILEWLGPTGILQYHHYLDARLFPQWEHLREWRESGGRVIWRTVGQSVEQNERAALPYRRDGLEIVRYSPKERNIPGYAGEDRFIRFYKDPEQWQGWHGEEPYITNVTQHLLQRHPWTNAEFYLQATEGLDAVPLGPGSEALPGGTGEMPLGAMRLVLRDCRAYLYTGTQPASYTLGLLEALMTGIPVVSIGPSHMQIFPYGDQLFEGHELASYFSDSPEDARAVLTNLLGDHALAQDVSDAQRARAIKEFGINAVGAQWKAYLDA